MHDANLPPGITPMVRLDYHYPVEQSPQIVAAQLSALPAGLRCLYFHDLPNIWAGIYDDPITWLKGGTTAAIKAIIEPNLQAIAAAGGVPDLIFVDIEASGDTNYTGGSYLLKLLDTVRYKAPKKLPVTLRNFYPAPSNIIGKAVYDWLFALRAKALKKCVRDVAKKIFPCVRVVNYLDDPINNVDGLISPSFYNYDTPEVQQRAVETCGRDVLKMGASRYIPWVDKTCTDLIRDLKVLGVDTFFYFNWQDYTSPDPAKLFGLEAPVGAHLPDVIMSYSPAGYWRLGEASGTTGSGSIIDASGNGNHGTPYDSPTFGAAGDVFGDSNTAVQFSGIQRIVVPVPSFSSTSAYTLSAFVKITAYPTSKYVRVISAETGSNDALSIVIAPDPSDNCYFQFSGVATQSKTTRFPLNTWVHVAIVSNGTTSYVYINGSEIGHGATGSVSSRSALGLNCSGNGGAVGGDCVLDEVAWFTTALSAAQVSAIYAAASSPNPVFTLQRQAVTT